MANNFLALSSNEKLLFLERLSFGDSDEINIIKKNAKDKIKIKKDEHIELYTKVKLLSDDFDKLKKPDKVDFPLSGKYDKNKIVIESQKYANLKDKIVGHTVSISNLYSYLEEYKRIHAWIISNDKKLKYAENKKNEYLDSMTRLNFDENGLSYLESLLEKYRKKKKYYQLKDQYEKSYEEYTNLCTQEMNTMIKNRDDLLTERGKEKDVDIMAKEIKELNIRLKHLISVNESNDEIYAINKRLSCIQYTEDDLTDLAQKEDKIRHEKDNILQRLEFRKCPKCDTSLNIQKKEKIWIVSEAKDNVIDKKTANEIVIQLNDELQCISVKIDAVRNGLYEIKNLEVKKSNLIRSIKECMTVSNLSEISIGPDSVVKLQADIQNKKDTLDFYTSCQYKINDLNNRINKKVYSTSLLTIKKKVAEQGKQFASLKGDEITSGSDSGDISSDSETDGDTFDEEETLSKIKTQRDARDKQFKYKTDFESVSKDIINYENEICSLNRKLSNVKKSVLNITNTGDRESLSEDDLTLYKVEKLYEEEKILLENSNHELLGYKNREILIKKYEVYRKELKAYRNFEEKLELHKKDEIECSHKLSMYNQFFKKIQEAESLIINSAIENINALVKFYLEKFFEDNPIDIRLMSFRETKKDIKPIINIQVTRDGIEMDLSSLSGGEIDRVSLAFILAVNQSVNSDILLLDECLSSLNQELLLDIVEVLKDHLHNKTILITLHQTVTSIFDNVVTIDDTHKCM